MHAVVRFLNNLVHEEMREQGTWFENSLKGEDDDQATKVKNAYVAAYGQPLLSYRLLLSASGQLRRIARASCGRDQRLEPDFIEVVRDYQSALVVAASENDKYILEFAPGRENGLAETYDRVLRNVENVLSDGITTSHWQATEFDEAGHFGASG